jgi:CRP-like cAMP-binding protein
MLDFFWWFLWLWHSSSHLGVPSPGHFLYLVSSIVLVGVLMGPCFVCPCIVQVPLFDQMDDSLLDAMCERLKPALNTEGTYIVREGDPVNEMLFIIRGKLESVTTNGGRTGFLNVGNLGPGDFCGEELLTWALDPKPSSNLPTSTRTVKAFVEVEAFALFAEDLKFVASQFRRLHSKQLQHTFRFLLLISPFVDLVKLSHFQSG